MNKQTIKTVKVSATGVQFGNCWLSHEQITGYTADQLNSGDCGIIGNQYVAWLSAEEPAPDFDEDRERNLFESASQLSDGIYWSVECNAYKSINGRSIECSDAVDATLRLQGWLACAKSRAVIRP